MINQKELIAIWDILHTKDIGELTFADLDNAATEVAGTFNHQCDCGPHTPPGDQPRIRVVNTAADRPGVWAVNTNGEKL